MSPKRSKFASALVHIHWVIVLLIVLSYFTIETRDVFGKENIYHVIAKVSHFYIGFTILFIMLFRIILKPFAKLPAVTPEIKSPYQKKASKIVHTLLYATLVIMPLLGWCLLSSYGRDIPFGLPSILPINHVLGHQLENIHGFIGNALLFLILFHASGALFNHYFLKNNTCQRMSFKSDKD